MRVCLIWSGSVLALALVPGILRAESKTPEAYAIRPSSQTIKHRQAALALSQSKDAAPLLSGVLKDPNEVVQASAARSLLMVGDASGLETAKSLAGSHDVSVRLIAIDALGWSKDPSAEAQLQTLLTQAPPDSLMAIQEALARTKQLRKS